MESLPDYSNPPVVETVLGVQFDRMPNFTNAHLGAFWRTLDANQWPVTSDAPLLPRQFERFTEAARWTQGIRLQLTQDPTCRLQIKNADGDRMVQVQNSRLHFNWLGEAGGTYPRYERVRDGFDRSLRHFIRFIGRENIGDFRPNQWEVIYVNHIPKGSVWSTPSDWSFFKPLGAVPVIEDLVEGESFTGEWHFVIPEQRGRLHVEWKHALKSANDEDDKELIRLTFTARGEVEPIEDTVQAILNGLDLGHKTIVSSFRELMSEDANKHWGL